MDLLQLRYFCHAARTENFSRTASAFYVPAASVSQSIKRLENELGARLFNRNANKIKLSAAGKTFYEKVVHAIALIDDAKKKVEDASWKSKGKIKILAQTCRRIVTQTVEKFKAAYPEVVFVIHHTSTAADETYDFIVSDAPASARTTQCSLLLSEKLLLACHRSHPLAQKTEIVVDDLKNEEFIAMSAGNSLHYILTDICTDAGFTPKIAIQSDDPFYLRKYLDEGLGIAIVPQISWRGSFSENVCLKPFGEYVRDTYVWFDEPKFLPRIQKQFLAYLKQAFDNEK
ncbi:MAG: LysR family transcriptional regulator [Clostridia bacterium]|nr:LysR family transcriptional regulator [Clostridia bacterium]